VGQDFVLPNRALPLPRPGSGTVIRRPMLQGSVLQDPPAPSSTVVPPHAAYWTSPDPAHTRPPTPCSPVIGDTPRTKGADKPAGHQMKWNWIPALPSLLRTAPSLPGTRALDDKHHAAHTAAVSHRPAASAAPDCRTRHTHRVGAIGPFAHDSMADSPTAQATISRTSFTWWG